MIITTQAKYFLIQFLSSDYCIQMYYQSEIFNYLVINYREYHVSKDSLP